MNLLLESGVIDEIRYDTNFAYILKDNSLFLSTEYKVLQSQTNGSFVKCMKMLHNGRIELYYLVNAYKPLLSLISQLDPNHFIIITGNLLSGIIDVKSNGFLSCYNIDTSFEHIYVDLNTFKVRLVYLPLSRHEYGDAPSFENALRANLLRVITDTPSLSSPKMTQLKNDLQNGMLTIEDVYSRLGGKSFAVQEKIQIPGNADVQEISIHGSMKLIALNAPTRAEIKITKQNFTIGKKETNDGVIGFNKMISRFHCKVMDDGQQFLICDLQSANGTFVNGFKLQPNVPVPVKNGDVVRLADSNFQVIIG